MSGCAARLRRARGPGRPAAGRSPPAPPPPAPPRRPPPPRPPAQPGGPQSASIYTPVRISNAFALRLELTSKERAGRLDFGPYQGASGNLAYRLAYRPGARPGLQLLRIGPQSTAVIASYDQPLALEDGWPPVVD